MTADIQPVPTSAEPAQALVPWSVPPRSPNARRPNGIGALVGMAVGAACSVLAIAALETGAFDQSGLLSLGLGLAIPLSIPAGAVAGWCFGPVAWRAHGLRAWAVTVVEQSVVAVLAGLASYALLGALAMTVSGQSGGAAAGLLFGLIVLIFGIALTPGALAPAAVGAVAWSVSMWLLRRHLAGRPS